MSIRKAEMSEFETVKDISYQAISRIYPRYYPMGAVKFFLSHHCEENIINDIRQECVFLCDDGGRNTVGTVTVKENEICRLFVLPDYQGNGYGRELLDFAESKIKEKYGEIILDSSLSAKGIYLKRGYKEKEYHTIKTENGDFLCYDIMVKQI